MSKYDFNRFQNCPICGKKMKFDLILKSGHGVNLSPVKPKSSDEIAGYGFFCQSCQRGWTGDKLLQINE